MKEKHIAGWITAALVIAVGVLSFPYVWFHSQVSDLTEHKFSSTENVIIFIDAYHKDTDMELTDRRSKNVVISALQRELEYTGPLWYRTHFRTVGEDEIYCIRVSDFSEDGGSWRIYISNNPLYSFLDCSDVFGAKLTAGGELLEILREYTTG